MTENKLLNEFLNINKKPLKDRGYFYDLDLAFKNVVIADEFAIGFAEWKDKYCIYYDGWNIRIPLGYKYSDGGYSNKELLEIYKKEKGL
jgi:hypothetical protein